MGGGQIANLSDAQFDAFRTLQKQLPFEVKDIQAQDSGALVIEGSKGEKALITAEGVYIGPEGNGLKRGDKKFNPLHVCNAHHQLTRFSLDRFVKKLMPSRKEGVVETPPVPDKCYVDVSTRRFEARNVALAKNASPSGERVPKNLPPIKFGSTVPPNPQGAKLNGEAQRVTDSEKPVNAGIKWDDSMHEAIRDVAPGIQKKYKEMLKKDPTLDDGVVMIRVMVSKDGGMRSAQVSDHRLSSMVMDVFRQQMYQPSSENWLFDVKLEFNKQNGTVKFPTVRISSSDKIKLTD